VLDGEATLSKVLAVAGSGTQLRSSISSTRSNPESSNTATPSLLPPISKASGANLRTRHGRGSFAKRSQSRLVEIRGLNGDMWIREEFCLTDQVLSIKQCVERARDVPPWQQMFTYQGQILADHTKLSDLDLPQQEVLFQVVRRLSPTSEDREALSVVRAALDAKMQLLDTLEPKKLVRIGKFDHPSESLAISSIAALHMLAGSLAPRPLQQGATWSSCRFIWAHKDLVHQLKLLPDKIANDALEVWTDRVQACRATISSLPGGDGDIEKLDYLRELGRRAWGQYAESEKIVEYLMAVLKYYDKIVAFREGFSGASMEELFGEP